MKYVAPAALLVFGLNAFAMASSSGPVLTGDCAEIAAQQVEDTATDIVSAEVQANGSYRVVFHEGRGREVETIVRFTDAKQCTFGDDQNEDPSERLMDDIARHDSANGF